MPSDNFLEHFEYPVLTKITGILNYQVIKKLKDEIKANAGCIYSELGGGRNGHLGLVCTPTEYALVTNEPYFQHTQPTRPNITAAMQNHTSTNKLDEYKEKCTLFKELVQLETVLLKLLSQALPFMYLQPFRTEESNAITTPIADILDTLMTTYGTVPEEDLLSADSALRSRVFDITKPLVIIYNEMDNLQQLATAAGLPYSNAQFINLSMRLIKNMNDFDKGLTKWFDLPRNQTYQTFKNHFTKAQNNIRRVRGPTMQSGILRQQANIMSQLDSERSQYLNAVSAVESRTMEAVDNSTPLIVAESHKDITTPAANAVSTDTVMLQVLKLLQKLDKKEEKREDNCKRQCNNNND